MVSSDGWLDGYELPKIGHGAERFWTGWYRSEISSLGHKKREISGLGHKKRESWRGLITNSAINLLSFLMPTHTHDFDNHDNGYGRSTTALMPSVSGSLKIQFFDGFETQKRFQNLARFMIFKIVILLIWLFSLMIYKRPNHPHQNKINDLLLRITRVRWQKCSRQLLLSI
jgi:hypothetical protein